MINILQNGQWSLNALESAVDNAPAEYALLSEWTAPFREHRIRAWVERWCRSHGIPAFGDQHGNLWLGVNNSERLNQVETVLCAHMDHPGFLVRDFRGGKAEATWLGAEHSLSVGMKVKMFSAEGETIDGHISKLEIAKDRPARATLSATINNPKGIWGASLIVPGLEQGFKLTNGKWFVRAADDPFLVVTLLVALRKTLRLDGKTAVLLTRSEERGELGAYFAAADTQLRSNVKVLSVDVSESEGALPGVGVVIKYLKDGPQVQQDKTLAEFIAGKSYKIHPVPELKTDAKAFSDMGHQVACISLPVQNMHNKNKESGIYPEIILESDRQRIEDLLISLLGPEQ